MKDVLEAKNVDREMAALVYQADLYAVQHQLLVKETDLYTVQHQLLVKELELAKANRSLETLKDRCYRLDSRDRMQGALGMTLVNLLCHSHLPC